MYLRIAGRVVFVGAPTAGCVGNAAFIRLPAGGRMSFTGMSVTWPDGSPFRGVGIIPDVEAGRTIRGLIEGRDEILEKGIETLKRISNATLEHSTTEQLPHHSMGGNSPVLTQMRRACTSQSLFR